MNYLFECLRYGTALYNLVNRWAIPSSSVRKYFLSEEDEYDESYTRVPEGAVYIEEWTNDNGKKMCYIQYEGEELEEHENPFIHQAKARVPWLWIGDKETEIDLTKTFNKFLIPGNVIQMDLVQKLIHITENTDLLYIDAKSFEPKKFPGEGILIEEDE